jgi:hypothetical protein
MSANACKYNSAACVKVILPSPFGLGLHNIHDNAVDKLDSCEQKMRIVQKSILTALHGRHNYTYIPKRRSDGKELEFP